MAKRKKPSKQKTLTKRLEEAVRHLEAMGARLGRIADGMKEVAVIQEAAAPTLPQPEETPNPTICMFCLSDKNLRAFCSGFCCDDCWETKVAMKGEE